MKTVLSRKHWWSARPWLALCLITITTPVPVIGDDIICSANSVRVVDDHPKIWPWQEYATLNSTPPHLQINTTGEPLAPGLILLTPIGPSVKEDAPIIMTDSGDLVWGGPPCKSSNLRVQTLFDQPVITYWQDTGTNVTLPAHGFGKVVILDTSYQQIYTVCPQLNLTGASSVCQADFHESFITSDNTILVTAYNITTADLRSVGGPENGYVIEPLAVEVDIATGKILFTWSPLDHVPINTTHWPLLKTGYSESQPFDWFHMNSIQAFEGYFLINSRHTWTSYLVDRSGKIIWQIDGQNGGDFGSIPAGGNFSWEHHTRLIRRSPTTVDLHLFSNNDGFPRGSHPSVGVALSLTLPPNSSQPPKLLTNLSDPVNPVATFAEGSYDILSNGNYFLGYGFQPHIKEFGPQSPSGADVRWSAQFGFKNAAQSYRAYKGNWHATPSSPPNLMAKAIQSGDELASCADGSNLRGFVSWNGATGVVDYFIYTGQAENKLHQIGKVRKQGFETKFVIPAGTKVVQIGAVQDGSDAGGVWSEIVYIQ